MASMKRRVYEVLAVAAPGDKLSRAFDVFLVALIASNILAMVLETVEPCYKLAPRFFAWFETVSVLVFTVEYILRVWSSTVSESYRSPVTGRHRRIANSASRNFALSSQTGVTTRRQADRHAPPHTARTPQPGTRPAPAVVRFLPAVSVNAR
jgi:hypothetical protein